MLNVVTKGMASHGFSTGGPADAPTVARTSAAAAKKGVDTYSRGSPLAVGGGAAYAEDIVARSRDRLAAQRSYRNKSADPVAANERKTAAVYGDSPASAKDYAPSASDRRPPLAQQPSYRPDDRGRGMYDDRPGPPMSGEPAHVPSNTADRSWRPSDASDRSRKGVPSDRRDPYADPYARSQSYDARSRGGGVEPFRSPEPQPYGGSPGMPPSSSERFGRDGRTPTGPLVTPVDDVQPFSSTGQSSSGRRQLAPIRDPRR